MEKNSLYIRRCIDSAEFLPIQWTAVVMSI